MDALGTWPGACTVKVGTALPHSNLLRRALSDGLTRKVPKPLVATSTSHVDRPTLGCFVTAWTKPIVLGATP